LSGYLVLAETLYTTGNQFAEAGILANDEKIVNLEKKILNSDD
jgi:hypothetical protein